MVNREAKTATHKMSDLIVLAQLVHGSFAMFRSVIGTWFRPRQLSG
jgi:hypothetical protein